jgi:hypothetical protein
MDFLSQTFTISVYYYMTKYAFDSIGHDYYKGLKHKLPPVRYLGTDDFNNELVCLAHPKDFTKQLDLFKNTHRLAIEQLNNHVVKNINIANIKNEILEIYPDTNELKFIPNGFVALFVNDIGLSVLNSEFTENDEVASINFIPVTATGIDKANFKLCGVIETFIKKFNSKPQLIQKYQGMYLTIGEIKDINILTGVTKSTNRFNIIGGKRTFDENSVVSTIREAHEELGLMTDSKISRFINFFLPRSNDIIKCTSFNVYCVHYSPNDVDNYDNFIRSVQQNQLLNQQQISNLSNCKNQHNRIDLFNTTVPVPDEISVLSES